MKGSRMAVALAAASGFVVLPGSARAALTFAPCGDQGAECGLQTVPLDYDSPGGPKTKVSVARRPANDQAHKLGTLVFNLGGPGGSNADVIRDYGDSLPQLFLDRFDVVTFDQRGTGESPGAFDCKVNQETQGTYRMPFTTPLTVDPAEELAGSKAYAKRCASLNSAALENHASTANAARDMDRIRKSIGEAKISYFGASYGTFLGATYAALFPRNYRAMALDSAFNPRQYINHPIENNRGTTAGVERLLSHYFSACAAHPEYCTWTGGQAPETAYDDLVEAADAFPIPADDDDVTKGDNRAVDGDTFEYGVLADSGQKYYWPELTQALNEAAGGDASLLRFLSDLNYADNLDGTYGPYSDVFYMITASERRYPKDVAQYFVNGEADWESFPHAWFVNGYQDLNYAVYGPHDDDAYYGPFAASQAGPTVLVIGTTGDARPYRESQSLVAQLGNARLLTMKGDGHLGAYDGDSACIDKSVDLYLAQIKLPAKNQKCDQDVPFPPVTEGLAAAGAPQPAAPIRPRLPLVGPR